MPSSPSREPPWSSGLPTRSMRRRACCLPARRSANWPVLSCVLPPPWRASTHPRPAGGRAALDILAAAFDPRLADRQPGGGHRLLAAAKAYMLAHLAEKRTRCRHGRRCARRGAANGDAHLRDGGRDADALAVATAARRRSQPPLRRHFGTVTEVAMQCVSPTSLIQPGVQEEPTGRARATSQGEGGQVTGGRNRVAAGMSGDAMTAARRQT